MSDNLLELNDENFEELLEALNSSEAVGREDFRPEEDSFYCFESLGEQSKWYKIVRFDGSPDHRNGEWFYDLFMVSYDGSNPIARKQEEYISAVSLIDHGLFDQVYEIGENVVDSFEEIYEG